MCSYLRICIQNPTLRNINYVIFARVNFSLLSSSFWFARLFFFIPAHTIIECILFFKYFFNKNKLCIIMHVFYKKYKHISLHLAFFDELIIFFFETCESSTFLWVYQKYQNNILVLFITILQRWPNVGPMMYSHWPTILVTIVEVISWHWP